MNICKMSFERNTFFYITHTHKENIAITNVTLSLVKSPTEKNRKFSSIFIQGIFHKLFHRIKVVFSMGVMARPILYKHSNMFPN